MGSRDWETGEKLGRCYECGGNGCELCGEYPDDDSMVDLGGGMVVPLRELLEDD